MLLPFINFPLQCSPVLFFLHSPRPSIVSLSLCFLFIPFRYFTLYPLPPIALHPMLTNVTPFYQIFFCNLHLYLLVLTISSPTKHPYHYNVLPFPSSSSITILTHFFSSLISLRLHRPAIPFKPIPLSHHIFPPVLFTLRFHPSFTFCPLQLSSYSIARIFSVPPCPSLQSVISLHLLHFAHPVSSTSALQNEPSSFTTLSLFSALLAFNPYNLSTSFSNLLSYPSMLQVQTTDN